MNTIELPISTIYKIGNTFIPSPSSCTANIYTLQGEDSGRTADGMMHTSIIATKRKVEIGYSYISKAQLAGLLPLLLVQYYSFTYLDPITGVTTIECYGSDLNQTLHSGVLYGGLWRDVKISCIER